MASKVRRARNNTFLHLVLPDVADDVLSAMQLAADYTSADKFAEVKSGGFQTSTGVIDVTNWDSGDWQEVVPDIHSGTIPVTTNLILDATYMEDLLSANEKGKPVGYLLVFGDVPGMSAKNICVAGFARITSFNLTPSDVHNLEFTLTIDGTPSFKQGATTYPQHDGTF